MFCFPTVPNALRSKLSPTMLQHKLLSICTSVFPTGKYFERLIPHSVRLTAVIAVPNLNCWLLASKNIFFPLPHSFGIDQPVLCPGFLLGDFLPGLLQPH